MISGNPDFRAHGPGPWPMAHGPWAMGQVNWLGHLFIFDPVRFEVVVQGVLATLRDNFVGHGNLVFA